MGIDDRYLKFWLLFSGTFVLLDAGCAVKKKDTFSAVFRSLQRQRAIRYSLMAGWGWATWHLFVQGIKVLEDVQD